MTTPTTTLTCTNCGRTGPAGSYLRAVSVGYGATMSLCRPGVSPSCIGAAESVHVWTIAMDAALADEYDKSRTDGGPRANGATFEKQARAWNAAISLRDSRYIEED